MNKETISEKQAGMFSVAYLIGSTLTIGWNSSAGRDAWISVLVGAALAAPMPYVYLRPIRLFQEENYLELLKRLFGKGWGKLFCLFYTFAAMLVGISVTSQLSIFVKTVSLTETPDYLIAMFVLVTAVWMAKAGIETIMRWVEILFVPIMAIILFSTIISFNNADYSAVSPILRNGFAPVALGGYHSMIFSFCGIFFPIAFFGAVKNKKKAPKKVYLFYLLAVLMIASTYFRNLVVLGYPYVSMPYFASYAAVSQMHIGEFIQRAEVLVTVVYLFSDVLKTAICILFASKGIAAIGNASDYRVLVVPVGAAFFLLSLVIHSNTTELLEWVRVYKYYASVTYIVLPIITWITAEAKSHGRPDQKQT